MSRTTAVLSARPRVRRRYYGSEVRFAWFACSRHLLREAAKGGRSVPRTCPFFALCALGQGSVAADAGPHPSDAQPFAICRSAAHMLCCRYAPPVPECLLLTDRPRPAPVGHSRPQPARAAWLSARDTTGDVHYQIPPQGWPSTPCNNQVADQEYVKNPHSFREGRRRDPQPRYRHSGSRNAGCAVSVRFGASILR